jgi:hypothetical protein
VNNSFCPHVHVVDKCFYKEKFYILNFYKTKTQVIMKLKSTKRLFAFIVVLMFFSLTQFAFTQKCNAKKHCLAGYKCVNGHCYEILAQSILALRDAGELHKIKLLDHLIITSDGYMSFADRGLISEIN